MALTYDQVSGLTHQLINESSADNIYDSNTLLRHLQSKGQVVEEGGIHIQLPIMYAKVGAAGTFKKYGLLDTTPNDTETAAKYLWKYNYGHVIVSKTELWENSGKSQAVNLLKQKTKNCLAAVRDNIGTQIFSTNDDNAEGVNGLRNTIDATGTVGGIAQSDFAGWASDEDAATAAMTVTALEQAILDASIGSDEPDLMVGTKAIWKSVFLLAEADQRFGPGDTYKMGGKYLLFSGIPIVHDSHCPAQFLFGINSRWMYWYVHSQANFSMEKIGPSPAQAVHIDRVYSGNNLCLDNRRMFFKFTALTS